MQSAGRNLLVKQAPSIDCLSLNNANYARDRPRDILNHAWDIVFLGGDRWIIALRDCSIERANRPANGRFFFEARRLKSVSRTGNTWKYSVNSFTIFVKISHIPENDVQIPEWIQFSLRILEKKISEPIANVLTRSTSILFRRF